MNEPEQRKMNFWTLYLVFYAALFLFAMIGGAYHLKQWAFNDIRSWRQLHYFLLC